LNVQRRPASTSCRQGTKPNATENKFRGIFNFMLGADWNSGMNIAEVVEMDVQQAFELFADQPRIRPMLQILALDPG
jgi:hypothetical protein